MWNNSRTVTHAQFRPFSITTHSIFSKTEFMCMFLKLSLEQCFWQSTPHLFLVSSLLVSMLCNCTWWLPFFSNVQCTLTLLFCGLYHLIFYVTNKILIAKKLTNLQSWKLLIRTSWLVRQFIRKKHIFYHLREYDQLYMLKLRITWKTFLKFKTKLLLLKFGILIALKENFNFLRLECKLVLFSELLSGISTNEKSGEFLSKWLKAFPFETFTSISV